MHEICEPVNIGDAHLVRRIHPRAIAEIISKHSDCATNEPNFPTCFAIVGRDENIATLPFGMTPPDSPIMVIPNYVARDWSLCHDGSLVTSRAGNAYLMPEFRIPFDQTLFIYPQHWKHFREINNPRDVIAVIRSLGYTSFYEYLESIRSICEVHTVNVEYLIDLFTSQNHPVFMNDTLLKEFFHKWLYPDYKESQTCEGAFTRFHISLNLHKGERGYFEDAASRGDGDTSMEILFSMGIDKTVGLIGDFARIENQYAEFSER